MTTLAALAQNKVVHGILLGVAGAIAVDYRKYKQTGAEWNWKAFGTHVGIGALVGFAGGLGFDVTGLSL